MPDDPELVTYTDDIEKKARENLAREISVHTEEETTANNLNPTINQSPISEQPVTPDVQSSQKPPEEKKESFGSWWEDWYRRWVRGKSGTDPSANFKRKLEQRLGKQNTDGEIREK